MYTNKKDGEKKKRVKDKKMLRLMLAAHLLENQFAIFLLVVSFKGIGPDAQHM